MSDKFDKFRKFKRNSEKSLDKLLELSGFSSVEDFKSKVKLLNTYSDRLDFDNVKDSLTVVNIEYISDLYDKYDRYINFIEEMDDILVDITDIPGFSYSFSSTSKLDKISSIELNIEKNIDFSSIDIKRVISIVDVINSTMGVEFILSDINIREIYFILKLIKSGPKPCNAIPLITVSKITKQRREEIQTGDEYYDDFENYLLDIR